MREQELRTLAETYGTPTYVFDAEALKTRLAGMKEIVDGKFHLCYSIKANPFLMNILYEETGSLEVCSPGELDLCKANGIPGTAIIYSGVNKTEQNIQEALDYPVRVLTCESLLHARRINALAKQKTPVLLRLNAGSQFGMSKEDLFSVLASPEMYPQLEIKGIHYFAGTQRKKLDQQKKELAMLKELYQEIEDTFGLRLPWLEYGPGLPVPLFEGEDFSDTLAPLKELAPALKEAAEWAEVTVEMGRFYVTECGCYLTKVDDLKTNKKTNYCLIDGGINHVNYLGQIMGMKVPVFQHLHYGETEGDDPKEWCLVGSLCTTGDVLSRAVMLNNVQIDDILVLENIGAYSVTEGIYLFLSRAMPKIVLRYGEGQYDLVRDTVETSGLNRRI